MIGKITLPNGMEAVMNDDGQWESDEEIVAQYLNDAFRPQDHGPACMPFGVCAVAETGSALGAKVEVRKTEPIPEGCVS